MMTIEEAKAHLTAKPDLDIFRRAIEILENREYTVYSCHALRKATAEKLAQLIHSPNQAMLVCEAVGHVQGDATDIADLYEDQYRTACWGLGTYTQFWNRSERCLDLRVAALNNFIQHAELAGMTKEPT